MAKAVLLLRERVVLDDTVFAERVVWRVPLPLRGSAHDLTYRLALVADRVCVLRDDDEAGKGDPRHTVVGAQEPYRFENAQALVAEFWKVADAWMATRTTSQG